MKAAPAKKPLIRIAVVENDPLRFVGFRALFDSEPDFELISASASRFRSMPLRIRSFPGDCRQFKICMKQTFECWWVLQRVLMAAE